MSFDQELRGFSQKSKRLSDHCEIFMENVPRKLLKSSNHISNASLERQTDMSHRASYYQKAFTIGFQSFKMLVSDGLNLPNTYKPVIAILD